MAGSEGKNSLGCAAAELARIEPPTFVYNAQAQVHLDATIASPDSQTGVPGRTGNRPMLRCTTAGQTKVCATCLSFIPRLTSLL